MSILNDVMTGDDAPRRVKRFATVGVLGTLVDIGLFTLLHVWLGAPILAANTVSYSAGMVNNFVLHSRWTYADRPRKTVGVQFPQSAAVSLSALVINNLLVLLIAPVLGVALAHPAYGDVAAKLAATGLSMCWSFVANTFWTFRE